MLHRAMAALRFVPRLQRSVSGKALLLLLLLLTSPKGRRCAGRSQGKQQPPGSVVGSAAGKAGGTPALLPWDAQPHKPGGSWTPANCPDPKVQRLNSPCQALEQRWEQRSHRAEEEKPSEPGKQLLALLTFPILIALMTP